MAKIILTISLLLFSFKSSVANPLTVFDSDYRFLNKLWSHKSDDIQLFLSPYIFVVDKKKSMMHLYFYNGQTQHIKSYEVVLGKNSGDKQVRGDLKTPEGIYFFERYIPGSKLDKKYGSFAITMNYPNNIDRIEEKTGHGIWLHGLDDGEDAEYKYYTEGCVVASNKDLENMKRFIQPGLTPIIIKESFIKDPKNYSARPKDSLVEMIHKWLDSWSSKDIDRYMDFYSEDFLDIQNNRNKASWRAYKNYLNKAYDEINVRADRISIYSHPKYTVVQFIQDYQSSSYKSRSIKRLYITKEESSYKIKNEEAINISSLRTI